MHALVQAVETVIVALAAAAFAHFGVVIKDAAPQPPQPPSVVRKIPVAASQMAPPTITVPTAAAPAVTVTTVAAAAGTADKPCLHRQARPV